MSVVARRIKAIPVRSASGVWRVMVDLLAPTTSDARNELLSIDGVASCLVASEAMKAAPVVVRGKGPCVRLYCNYGEDAIVADDANETPLAICPTEGDWSVSLPCPVEDLKWVQAALMKQCNRVTARDMSEAFAIADESGDNSAAATINVEAFLRS